MVEYTYEAQAASNMRALHELLGEGDGLGVTVRCWRLAREMYGDDTELVFLNYSNRMARIYEELV